MWVLRRVKPQDVAKRNGRDRGTGVQARRVSNTELNPRRVTVVPDFWKTLIDEWQQEGRPGVSPVDRQSPLDELSNMALSGY